MSLKKAFKFHIDPVYRKDKLRYTLTIYEYGERIGFFKYINNLDYPLHYFLFYRQSLLESKHVIYRKKSIKSKGSRIVDSDKLLIIVDEGAYRFGQIYLMYLLSILNIRSRRRVDKLAKCFGDIDPISPLVDNLWSMKNVVSLNRYVQMLRGYCLCLK